MLAESIQTFTGLSPDDVAFIKTAYASVPQFGAKVEVQPVPARLIRDFRMDDFQVIVTYPDPDAPEEAIRPDPLSDGVQSFQTALEQRFRPVAPPPAN
jgi:hypothetical protein